MELESAKDVGDNALRPLTENEKKCPDLQESFIAAREDFVSFEEYIYWAKITRADEKAADNVLREVQSPRTVKSIVKGRFSKGDNGLIDPSHRRDVASGGDEVVGRVSEDEWKTASRAMRTAGWGAIFYLITTDVLGPWSTAWAFAHMGYGPGAALYTVFGIMAGYSGWIIWQVFLGLDSDRYPLRTWGDLFLRVFGRTWQRIIDFMLSAQLMLFVSLLILSNGQSISQISQGITPGSGTGICFVACLIIFMAAGFVIGQIRTLQRFAWIANFSVWINLVIIFICMGVVAHYPPNFKATEASFGKEFGPGPVRTFAGTPPDGYTSGGSGLIASLNGLNQAVYSYGGCLAFTAFLAEMWQPMDFWKALLCGQVFIYAVYMFFGIFVYSYQGQYSFNPTMQGLSPYGFQTATNVMNIVTGLIAAALYANIGLKVAYIEVFQGLFNFPPLTKTGGKIAWAVMMPLYWALAFIVAASVPQFNYVSGLISALFTLNFTYTFPAVMAIGYWIKKDAMVDQERLDPRTGRYTYVDAGMARWKRGFMQRPLFNFMNLLYMLGGLVTSGLGIYSSVKGLIDAFSGKSAATSFGCTPPV
ncbi:hypothetical protein HIM_02975 [Hirsutella minnesotensis 3608]|nr:hypothetical protein HIM_02975 [Hirsutella minnesotensis 3608]